jgi:molybdopterin synthase catalytic subunit
MGTSKAALVVGGKPLARLVGERLSAVADPAVEVGPSHRSQSGLPVVEEEPPGRGPLVAVVAGWLALVERTGDKRPALVLSCDLHRVTVAMLGWLASFCPAARTEARAASLVPVVGGYPQYLCARWSVTDLERARALVEAGESAVKLAFGADALFVDEDGWGEVAVAGDFADLDTPDDLASAGVAPPLGCDDWVAMVHHDLDMAVAGRWVVTPECGAVALFAGTVRDRSGERIGVEELVYESYEPAATATIGSLVASARQRWPEIGRTAVLHRVGRLVPSETAVVVAVSAPHRPEAFEAARYLIDAVKERAPIWKYERWRGDGCSPGGEDWGICP